MPDLHPSSWDSGLQMGVQTINEYAEEGGTEWATLSEADGWALAWATLTTDPQRQQRAIIQGLDSTQHVAMHPQALQQAPKEMPLNLVISRLQIHKAEVKGLTGMPVLVNDMLKGEGRVDGAKLWAIACLSAGSQLFLLSVLDQTLYHDASIEPDRLAN